MQLVCFVTVLLLGVSGTAAAFGNIRLPILGGQKFPATGQVLCYGATFTTIPCAGTGHDGEIQAGATLSFRDNSNGTITDRNTKLVWEKKSDDGSIHDQDHRYLWDEAFAVHVHTLNNICSNNEGIACSVNADCAGVGGKCGCAGKRDWRLPNVKELQSFVNYGNAPALPAEFNTNCVAGATVLTGSCTAFFSYYWSSTSHVTFPWALAIESFEGTVGYVQKDQEVRARAVRGGL